ncbi:MAG: zinc ribbon domain-containing protein [Promethearchaeota archaeon]
MVENFPKKCIVCKETNVDLIALAVSVSKVRGGIISKQQKITTQTYEVPVCKNCVKMLARRDYLKELQICIGLITFIIFLISIVSLMDEGSYLEKLLTIAIVLIIINIPLFFIKPYISENIKNYVKLKFNDTLYNAIVDPEYKQDIDNFLKERVIIEAVEKELSVNIMFCPKCGSKQKKDSDFCLECGKDLRTLRI